MDLNCLGIFLILKQNHRHLISLSSRQNFQKYVYFAIYVLTTDMCFHLAYFISWHHRTGLSALDLQTNSLFQFYKFLEITNFLPFQQKLLHLKYQNFKPEFFKNALFFRIVQNGMNNNQIRVNFSKMELEQRSIKHQLKAASYEFNDNRTRASDWRSITKRNR